MKKILLILYTSMLIVAISGCNNIDTPLMNKDSEIISSNQLDDITELKYSIENVVMSKSFQCIDPKVEIKKDGKNLNLVMHLGVFETSGVTVDNIELTGNTVDIYINNNTDKDTLLAVPQVTVNLKDNTLDTENLRFNIINQNYKPINIKYNVSQVLNKIVSSLNITANSSPTVNLYKEDDKYIWNIQYNAVFDTENIDNPLVNLLAKIDASTGELIESNKSQLSSYIDEGHFLDYVVDKSILYKKVSDDNQNLNSMWIYYVDKDEKKQIYQTKGQIVSASYSPDNKSIAIIEKNGIGNELFIINKDDTKVYKAILEDINELFTIRWKDKNNLILLSHLGNNSNIHEYDIKQNKSQLIGSLDKKVLNLRVYKDEYLLSIDNDNNRNRNIYHTENLGNLEIIDTGFNPIYVNNNTVAYIKNKEEDDKNILHIYNIQEKESLPILELNVQNISKINDDEIFIIEKNSGNNSYTSYKYNIDSNELTSISNVNSDRVYYSEKNNLIYVDTIIPFKSNKSEILYSIDLNKTANTP